jgi:Casein kinase II regulatory subunit
MKILFRMTSTSAVLRPKLPITTTPSVRLDRSPPCRIAYNHILFRASRYFFAVAAVVVAQISLTICGFLYSIPLDTILDVDIPEGELDERQQELVEVSAETLYGLIHARFILTARGMNAMLSKYTEGAFGRCPRVYCGGQTVLPVGQSDMPRCSTVKIFCPMCWDLYFPRSRTHNTLDGSYWGTTFPHLFLHTYQTLVPQRNPERYVPRIYGFKIHKSAAQVQRNLGGSDGTTQNPFPSNGPNGQRAPTPVQMVMGGTEEIATAEAVPGQNDTANCAPPTTALRVADAP